MGREGEEGEHSGGTTEGHKETFGITGCDLEGSMSVYILGLIKL